MGLFSRTDPNIARILVQMGILNGKVDQIMSTNNTLASQLQTVAANLQGLETKIEADLTTLATNQSTALADFKAWLSSNSASTIDAASIATLNAVAAKFTTVDTTLTTLASTVQGADPGAPPAAPVNG